MGLLEVFANINFWIGLVLMYVVWKLLLYIQKRLLGRTSFGNKLVQWMWASHKRALRRAMAIDHAVYVYERVNDLKIYDMAEETAKRAVEVSFHDAKKLR